MSDLRSISTVPAEWDSRVNAVLLAYPDRHTDWNYMLEDARDCFNEIISALVTEADMKVLLIGNKENTAVCLQIAGIPLEQISIIEIPYNDTWARDFGPLMLNDKDGNINYLDFKFNGWGLKFPSDKDNTICRRLEISGILPSLVNFQGFVLEGGSIESDGKGTLLTTSSCLLSRNRNAQLGLSEITAYLKKTLSADRILWLNHGYLEGDDTDSHIDTLARFVNESTIAYVKCDDQTDPHFNELKAMEEELKAFKTSDGNPYKLLPLPMPDAVYDNDKYRLPATYANFLITPKTVLLPIYGQPCKDRKAKDTLERAFPKHTVIPIDCSALIQQHGSLHCITMQLILK